MERNMNTVKFATFLSIGLFLSACGGGGSDSSPTPTPPPVATTYTVSASAGTGGSISPSSRSVTSGQTATFTVTPNAGYEIDRVTGCSGSLSGSTYTTGAITSTCSVSALFKQTPSTGIAVSGKVIDGYISGATVFLDLNGNEQLDTNEPRAITNDEGDYNLVLTDEEAQCRTYSALVVDVPVGAQDADFGEVTEAFRLVYPPTLLSNQESTHITPLTTVIWDFYKYQIQHIERDSAEPLSCESLAQNQSLFDDFSEKVERVIDEVVRRFNLPRSVLFDDYIASEDQVTAELGRQIVLGLQRSLRETFELQQQHPNAVVLVNYLRDEISWMKHVYRSTSETEAFENGWLLSGETEAYTDRLTDDFSETIGEREFWLRRGIEKDFDNYKVGISDLQEHCGSMDFLVVNFRDQGLPSFEVEVTNLSEITAAEADAYCGPRSRGKYVFAPLLNVGENERGSFQMMVRYDEVNERFAAFDDWKDFYERRDSFPYAEMPQRLLEWRFDYFDDLTEIDFFQIADSIYFSFSRYEDGLWVQYQKAGTALGVYGWRETRTVNNADGTRTFFCREADEVDFTSCDTPRFEVNASAGVGGSITPLKRNLLSGSAADFTITPDAGYEIESVTGCSGSLSGNTYTTGVITTACQIEVRFAALAQCTNPHNPEYPEEFLGDHQIPNPQYVLDESWYRGISFKDYFPGSVPSLVQSSCTNSQYAKLMYQLSLDQMAETGATMAWIYNYGRWDDATAEKLIIREENYQISEEMLEYIVLEANKRGIGIYYAWQFTTLDVEGRTIVELGENVTTEKLRYILDAHRTQVIKMAQFAERTGMKGLAVDWNAMNLGNLYEREIEEIYISSFSEIIDRIRESFSGEITWGQIGSVISDPRVIDKVDAIHVSLGGPMLTIDENENLSPTLIQDSILKQIEEFHRVYSCVHGCNYKPSTRDVPVLFEIAVQSRDKYWTEGWIEDGFCVSGTIDSGEELDCIQETYVTDFSVQAIGIEGVLRAIDSKQYNFTTKGVNFHSSYWHTDTLVPGEEGFPNLSQSIRGKPAEDIVRYWFKGSTEN
jgi:hypothetical protein